MTSQRVIPPYKKQILQQGELFDPCLMTMWLKRILTRKMAAAQEEKQEDIYATNNVSL